MDNIINVDELVQLVPFANKDGIIEVVVREANKRIKAFPKILVNAAPKEQAKGVAERVISVFGNQRDFVKNSAKILKQMANLQSLDLILNGLNLCATCAGFAIMYAKLDAMTEEITQQINQLQNVVKKGNDTQTQFEFNKVLGDHQDMLDRRRIKRPYSEEQMRDLVDREYNTLSLMVEVLQKDISSDQDLIIHSIFSMLAMMTVSLCYFDEIYYQNNHEVLGDTDVWHSSHDKWMKMYDILSSEWMMEKLQDHAAFDLNLDMTTVDVYYMELLENVYEAKQKVEDNQTLILEVKDINQFHEVQNYMEHEIQKRLATMLDEAFGEEEEAELRTFYQGMCEQTQLV